MMVYTLILTLVAGHQSSIGVVPGFATRAQCHAAGDAWLRQVYTTTLGNWAGQRALCVPVKASR